MPDKAPLSSHPVKLLNLALIFRLQSWMWNNVRLQTSSFDSTFPKKRIQVKLNRRPLEKLNFFFSSETDILTHH